MNNYLRRAQESLYDKELRQVLYTHFDNATQLVQRVASENGWSIGRASGVLSRAASGHANNVTINFDILDMLTGYTSREKRDDDGDNIVIGDLDEMLRGGVELQKPEGNGD